MIDQRRHAGLLVALAVAPIAWAILFQMELLPAAVGGWLLLRVVLVQPVVEELVFRGLLQEFLLKKLKQRFGFISLANLLTALAFTAAHFLYHPPLWAASVFVPGLVFGYFRERYDHVWPAVLLHTWYNAGFFLLPVILE